MKALTAYDFPRDLKNMSVEELELLSYAIRDFLLMQLSKTGGHVASNLGIVELTIALHKVFNSPHDKIIWDVGHQSYVHKILTGRAGQFDTLRQFNGMSGFPKGRESDHDVYDTGHSSVSISAAAGMAAARDLRGEKNEVIAVIGDGSLTGGMAFEGLNNIGDSKSKVIVILNDNGMSISPNIGGISAYLGRLRTSKGYLEAKEFIKNKVSTIPSIGKGLADGLAAFKNDVKYSLLDYGGVLFEELGFTYFGPVDGHSLPDLLDVLNRAKGLNEPVLVHVMTKKGKGYRNAEQHPDQFHGIGPFNLETGICLNVGKQPTFSELMGRFACQLAEDDPRIVAVTAAMGKATGLGPFAMAFPDRFFDVGIAEEHAVSFAAGLAKNGMRPLVAIYSSFLQRGYDQLLEDICLQELPVVFLLDRAGCVGSDGETHHGLFDLSYLGHMPGMTVLAPRNGEELQAMMRYAVALQKPCAIRYPKGETVYHKNNMTTFTFSGQNYRLYPAEKLDIWSVGIMTETALAVRERLTDRGIACGLVHVAKVKPADYRLVAPQTTCLFTLEDNVLTGGFGQQMAAAFCNHPLQVYNFGWPDAFIEHGSVSQLRQKYGLTPEAIVERICEYLEGKA